MTIKSIWDNFTDRCSFLPIHPQFIIKFYGESGITCAKKQAHGVLIDIGCGRMPYRKILMPFIDKYIGVDHPKTSQLYKGQVKPDILADATKIPLPDKSCDCALLLMVVEHLPEPHKALIETNRLLKMGGILVLSTVQNYPIHDAPYDYQRFTKYGLSNILKNAGFKVVFHQPGGNVVVLFLQNINLSLMLFLKWLITHKSTLCLALLILPITLIVTTISNFLSLPFLSIRQEAFALTHTIIAKKIKS